jgi:hypothetical protein
VSVIKTKMPVFAGVPMAGIAFALAAIACSATVVRSQSLDLQEKCASQARKAFQALEDEENEDPSSKGWQVLGEQQHSSTYQSHYNTKLNRCLMLTTDLHALQDDNVEVVTLVDANERRRYATYQEMRSHEAVRKDLQTGTKTSGKVFNCKLTPSIRQETTCKNREEFDAFVAKYMEE